MLVTHVDDQSRVDDEYGNSNTSVAQPADSSRRRPWKRRKTYSATDIATAISVAHSRYAFMCNPSTLCRAG